MANFMALASCNPMFIAGTKESGLMEWQRDMAYTTIFLAINTMEATITISAMGMV